MNHVDASFTSCVEPYHSTLSALAVLDLEAARGAQVHARAKWVEEGETSSAYFFCLEKKRAADRLISALQCNDGTVVSSSKNLCQAFASFYSNLFPAKPTDRDMALSLLDALTSTLSADQAKQCDGSLHSKGVLYCFMWDGSRQDPGLGWPPYGVLCQILAGA